MKSWLRNGVMFGGAAFAATFGIDVLGWATHPSNICKGTGLGLLLTLVSTALFLVLAGGAGWRTTQAGLPVGSAALAGLVTGAISGLAVILYFWLYALPDVPAVMKCSTQPAGAPSVDVFKAFTIVVGVFIALVGLGIGAGAGAIGGSIGQRRDTA
jgi:hypothetical protein